MKDFCLHETTKLQFWTVLRELLATGKRWRIKITEWKETRSLSQNNLMWKWNDEIAKQVAAVSDRTFTEADLHEFLKDLYCPEKEISILGITRKVKSTKLLDTGEMHFYLNQIDVWAHQQGLKITIPDDSEYRQLQRRQVA